ncbi:MAG: LysR family transcriptional regulator [Pseudomonadota bacterium]
MQWSDLRVFLAIAQTGSLRRAADVLGVAQPTVSRRLHTLEQQIGVPLFERARDGHRLTKAGAALLPDIRDVENAVRRVEQQVLGLTDARSETVRVGAGETSAAVLARGLHLLQSGPAVELVLTDASADLQTRKPDIAVLHNLPKSGSGQVRRVGTVENAVYGLKRFADGAALPLTEPDLSVLPWLSFVEEQDHYITMAWLRGVMRDRPPTARLMNSDLMIAAARRGVGVAVLPTFKGEEAADLLRLSGLIEPLRADYWAVIQPDLAQNPSIRAVLHWIIDCFRGYA